jgi:hypothetical protein
MGEAPVFEQPTIEGLEGAVDRLGVSRLRASSMPTPSVGKKIAFSTRCFVITSSRASRSRYSGRIGSRSPNAWRIESPSGFSPRK